MRPASGFAERRKVLIKKVGMASLVIGTRPMRLYLSTDIVNYIQIRNRYFGEAGKRK